MADDFLVDLGLAEPHRDVAVHHEGRAAEVLDERGREFLPLPSVPRVDGLDQRCVAQPVQAGRATTIRSRFSRSAGLASFLAAWPWTARRTARVRDSSVPRAGGVNGRERLHASCSRRQDVGRRSRVLGRGIGRLLRSPMSVSTSAVNRRGSSGATGSRSPL